MPWKGYIKPGMFSPPVILSISGLFFLDGAQRLI